MSDKMRRYTPGQVERSDRQAWCAHADVSKLETRVAVLESAVGEYLSDMGACANDGDEYEDTLCNVSGCLYCAMARAHENTDQSGEGESYGLD